MNLKPIISFLCVWIALMFGVIVFNVIYLWLTR